MYIKNYVRIWCGRITWPPWVIFFFNDTATTEIYTLSVHDALPICDADSGMPATLGGRVSRMCDGLCRMCSKDRKSTRLNSSHANISYAVFCLKKKKKKQINLVMSIISFSTIISLANTTISTYTSMQ